MMVQEKRKYIRLKSIFPVAFRIIDSEHNRQQTVHWQQGYTSNVSKGGICLETAALSGQFLDKDRPQDICLELRIHMPLARVPVQARARVAWIKKEDGDMPPKYLAGLEFSAISPADAERIVGQARWLRFSTRSAVTAAILLFIIFIASSYQNYRLRAANERLVDDFLAVQQEEQTAAQILEEISLVQEEIGQKMKNLSADMTGRRQLMNQYEELVKRKERIADRLTILAREKGGLQKTVLNKMRLWLKNHQSPSTGLILSFEGNVGVVKDWAFIYDQALAANVFLLFDDVTGARQILNFFRRTLKKDFQGFFNAYYFDSGDIAEYTVHCGPNIWIGLAAMQYIHKTSDDGYLPLARTVADWLISIQDKDPAGGLKGGPPFSWFSTEHNLDAYAFFSMLYQLTREEKYRTARDKVLSWLSAYAMVPHSRDYQSPPINRGRGDATIATDTFAWSLAAVGPKQLEGLGMEPEQIMNFAEEHCAVTVDYQRPSGVTVTVKGFDFAKHANMPRGGMVSPEWTAQMIVAYQILSDYLAKKEETQKAGYYAQKAELYMHELNKLIISSPSAKGQGEGCLPYATLEDADTGHGWHTPWGARTCSVAGTAYLMMAMQRFNPLTLKQNSAKP